MIIYYLHWTKTFLKNPYLQNTYKIVGKMKIVLYNIIGI